MKNLRLTILFILVLSLGYGIGEAQNKVKSYAIRFEAKNLGFKVPGSVSGLIYNIQHAELSPEFWKISGTVDTKTLNTGNHSRDHHLSESDYFDVEHFPIMKMESTQIKPLGKNRFLGTFNLSIKDKTKIIQIPFGYEKGLELSNIQGEFKINRRDFNIGGKSLILSDSILVKIKIEL